MDTISYLTINDETKEIADKASRNNIENIAATIAAHGNDIAYIQLETSPQGSIYSRIGDAYSMAYTAQAGAVAATQAAALADERALDAASAASNAWQYAGDAYSAANRAWDKAEEASTAATLANSKAESASNAANAAWNQVQIATSAASNAWDMASNASNAAILANIKAESASNAASTAQNSARQANTYAQGALAGMATLESVIDTVQWFTDHRTLSTDTIVNPNKNYYIYDENTGTLSKAQAWGVENPSEEGWYEIDETIQNYIGSRIAETNDGLFVTSTAANGWRVLVSPGTGKYTEGIFIIDSNGVVQQAMTGNGITFNSNSVFYLGDPTNEETPYFVFNGQNGTIDIGGSGVNIHSGVTIGQDNKTLSEILNNLDSAITSVEYGIGNSSNSHSDIYNWSTNAPQWQPDKYVWMRTSTNGQTYTYTCVQGAQGPKGDTGEIGETGAPGLDGLGILSVEVSYAITNSDSIIPEDNAWKSSLDHWYSYYGYGTEDEDIYGYTGYTGDTGYTGEDEYDYEEGETGETGETGGFDEESLLNLQQGVWLWVRTTTTYTDFTSSVTYQKSYIGVDGEKGETGEAGPQGPAGQAAIRVEIDPIGGNFIKRGQVGTSLIAHVYEGINDITNQFNHFTWYRRKADGTRDTSWSTQETSNQLSITTADVDESAVFVCEVTVTR